MKNKIFPHTFWRPFLDCMPQLFFRPKYVWFPIPLKGPMIPDPSRQLAELIVYITSTRVDLYSHQILLDLWHHTLVNIECNYNNFYYTPVWKTDVLCRGNVRPSVHVFRMFLQHALRYQFETWYIHSVGGTTCQVWIAKQLGLFDLVYSQK